MIKTIIAGGRDYQFTDEDLEFLNKNREQVSEVVCGGASGADANGQAWAESHGIPVKMFPADWKKYGRAAGPIRNREMAEYADALILFPGGRGSESMRREAEKAGLKVLRG